MSKKSLSYLPISLSDIQTASKALRNVARTTPLQFSDRLSKKYGAKIYLKREDLQYVRSYKLRGAYNFISNLSSAQNRKGIVCASAGNHAQGVAHSCNLLKIQGLIFMPKTTPKQKIQRVEHFGDGYVKLELIGDTFDETSKIAQAYAKKSDKIFVHPFDHELVVAGQATVGVEIFEQATEKKEKVDIIVVPVGGGGLISGVGLYANFVSPQTKIFGVEPAGAACMMESFKKGKVTELKTINKFVDGAAVKRPGELNFKIAKLVTDKLLTVEENKVCFHMLELYQSDGIIAEPAGALTVSALDDLANDIRGKTVVCVISGGNNDISRYSEIIERSLIYQELKHYFVVDFVQRAGALKDYLNKALGPQDDIVLFEYIKKTNRESGPALIGIELNKKQDLAPLLKRMNSLGLTYELLDPESNMFRFLV